MQDSKLVDKMLSKAKSLLDILILNIDLQDLSVTFLY